MNSCFNCKHVIVYEDRFVGVFPQIEDCLVGFGKVNKCDIDDILEIEECEIILPQLCECYEEEEDDA